MPRRNRHLRNFAAQSPLLRKGGLHEKSKSGQRTRERLSTNSAIDEWLEELEETNLNEAQEKGSESSLFLNVLFSDKGQYRAALTTDIAEEKDPAYKINEKTLILTAADSLVF